MRTKTVFYWLALQLLMLAVFMGEAEARRKILRGRKTITRRYYRGLAIPAWSVVVLSGLGMLTVGGGLYVLLRKLIVKNPSDSGTSSYHPAMQDDA